MKISHLILIILCLPACGINHSPLSSNESHTSSSANKQVSVAAQELSLEIFSDRLEEGKYSFLGATISFVCRKKDFWIDPMNPFRFGFDSACDLLTLSTGDDNHKNTADTGSSHLGLKLDVIDKKIQIPQATFSYAQGFGQSVVACVYLTVVYDTLEEFKNDKVITAGVHCNVPLAKENKPKWLNVESLGVGTFLRENGQFETVKQFSNKETIISIIP